MLCQVTGIYTPDVENGFYTLFPTLGITDFSKLGETFGKCFTVDFDAVGIINFIVVIFSFLFVDIFDTLGTLIGVATKADMLDEEGRLPGIRPALMADAIATSFGAVLGTSTTTTFVESASGVAVGGRTGLTALVSALLFLLSTLFAPIFTAIQMCIRDRYFNNDIWMKAFETCGVDIDFYTTRERSLDEVFPWDFIDAGVTKDFLKREWANAQAETVTPNCRMRCSGCGVRK